MRDTWAVLLAMVLVAPALADEVPDLARLRHLVVQDCGSCHGLTLKGGLGSPLTPDSIAHLPPQAMADVILRGVPGTPMPAWEGLLTRAEAEAIGEMLARGLEP
jgi:cytochrome c55X